MQAQIAELLGKLTQGVYVIGVGADGNCSAFTAAWVMQVSFEPLLVALSINPVHKSYALLRQSGFFSVNVLSVEQLQLAIRFGRSDIANKLENVAWSSSSMGVPLLDAVPAWIECQCVSEYPAGDHCLVVGRVIGGELRSPDTRLLQYSDTGGVDASASLFPENF